MTSSEKREARVLLAAALDAFAVRAIEEGNAGAVPDRVEMRFVALRAIEAALTRKSDGAGAREAGHVLAMAPGPTKRRKGWLRKAVEPLLTNWGEKYGFMARRPTVCGVPDEYHSDPRFGIHEYQDHDGNLTLSMMIGNDHSRGGTWVMLDFTPDQCVQIVAAILSRPSIERPAKVLLDALHPKAERDVRDG